MKLSKTTKIVLIICIAVVLLGYGVLEHLSDTFDLESTLAALGTFISGLLLGLVGRGKKDA